MIPVNWCANVHLPVNGWFGADGFATERDARAWIARQYRDMRRSPKRFLRPTYAGRRYCTRAYVLA